MHSHTPEATGLTAPLSMADIENLIDNDKIMTVCAINNKGEYSVIEKMPDRYYDDTLCDIMDEKCCAGLVNLFSGSKKTEYAEFLKSLNSASDRQPNETSEEFSDRMLSVEDSLDEYYDFATSLKDFPKYMEDFWKKNAKALGFNYYSNFSF